MCEYLIDRLLSGQLFDRDSQMQEHLPWTDHPIGQYAGTVCQNLKRILEKMPSLKALHGAAKFIEPRYEDERRRDDADWRASEYVPFCSVLTFTDGSSESNRRTLTCVAYKGYFTDWKRPRMRKGHIRPTQQTINFNLHVFTDFDGSTVDLRDLQAACRMDPNLPDDCFDFEKLSTKNARLKGRRCTDAKVFLDHVQSVLNQKGRHFVWFRKMPRSDKIRKLSSTARS